MLGLDCVFLFYSILFCSILFLCSSTKKHGYLILLQLHIQCKNSTAIPSQIFLTLTVFPTVIIRAVLLLPPFFALLFLVISVLSVLFCVVSLLFHIHSSLLFIYILVSHPAFTIKCSSYFCCNTIFVYSILFYSTLTFLLFAAFLVSQYQVQ